MPTLRVSATQFSVDPIKNPDDFWARVEDLVRTAAKSYSQLILFPEYFTLPWLLALNQQNFEKALDGFSAQKTLFFERFLDLAKQFQITIVAGSAPVTLRTKTVNRAFVFLPDGRHFEQDKQHLTRFEKEVWNLSPGAHNIRFWEWRSGALGVAMSYDIEIPAYTEELVSKDVDTILLPSATGDVHGYWRVRHCAQARAVESQSYVVMSSLVGQNEAIPPFRGFYGRAGFFSPCDRGFPDDGVLALGELNQEGLLTETLKIGQLHQVRTEGTTLNRRDLV